MTTNTATNTNTLPKTPKNHPNIYQDIRNAFHEVGTAIRYPEDLATRWQERNTPTNPAHQTPQKPALTNLLFIVLLATSALCLVAYGMTMHLHRGPTGMLEGALYMPIAAGIALTIAFPALYIINSLLGSKIDFSTTLLAATITVTFGSLALLASVPITWFFSLAKSHIEMLWFINFIIFSGVGFCMHDVFQRIMRALTPTEGRFYPFVWLSLLTFIGFEFFWLFGLFNF